jgi:hypothetical protein
VQPLEVPRHHRKRRLDVLQRRVIDPQTLSHTSPPGPPEPPPIPSRAILPPKITGPGTPIRDRPHRPERSAGVRRIGSVSLTVFPAASISRFRRSGIGRRR